MKRPDRYPVADVLISATTLPDATACILEWVRTATRTYVNVCTADTTVQCHDAPALAAIVNAAGMATPDGMPLVWVGRARGLRVSRVYGPDLMLAVCEAGLEHDMRHYLYGATDEVLTRLQDALTTRFPRIHIAGSHAPPYRALTEEEKADTVQRIDASGADLVWVGLGTPKQDYWLGEFRPRLQAPVLIGVGAAFDFHAGTLRQAPRWMMRCGLEWLFRLAVEPRRLWRRYLIGIPRFLWIACRHRDPGA